MPFFTWRRLFRRPPSQAKRSPRKVHLGEHYNLAEIYAAINNRYFEGKLDLQITWSGSKHRMPKRRVLFGSYHQKTQLIRIHRRLDLPHVPLYVVSYVVYHEMLHHVLPPIKGRRRRRSVHHPAFLERERVFEEYQLAQDFLEKSMEERFGKKKTTG